MMAIAGTVAGVVGEKVLVKYMAANCWPRYLKTRRKKRLRYVAPYLRKSTTEAIEARAEKIEGRWTSIFARCHVLSVADVRICGAHFCHGSECYQWPFQVAGRRPLNLGTPEKRSRVCLNLTGLGWVPATAAEFRAGHGNRLYGSEKGPLVAV
jgi:hypothetical protein